LVKSSALQFGSRLGLIHQRRSPRGCPWLASRTDFWCYCCIFIYLFIYPSSDDWYVSNPTVSECKRHLTNK